MTLDYQLDIANTLLATGLVRRVYHSCMLLKNKGGELLYPAYPRGAELSYTGIDDQQGLFAYLRSSGDIVTQRALIGGCEHGYEVSAPLRVVCFSDPEDRDFGYLLTKLLSFTFLPFVQLQRITDDKYKLLREESDHLRGNFDGKTFYLAFDVTLNFVLLPNTCEQAACTASPNPVCL